MSYDTHMWCRHNATPKHKDALNFYPCVASVVLGVSGFINLPFVAEMIFMIFRRYSLLQSDTDTCVHVVN